MGILAVIFNALTVFRGVSTIKQCQTEKMLITKALVSIIGLGDLLIGVYLVALSVYDSLVFGKKFCSYQAEWLTGTACLVLGVVSTLGSQLSLFAMTLLSMIRVYGLIGNKLMKSSRVNKRAIGKTTLSVMGVVVFAIAIAFIPLIPRFENYFVQGMYYDKNYKVFIGFPNKERHVKILKTYFKDELMNLTTTDMTWQKIGEKVDNMFSQQYGVLKRWAVHFYGNDGVCLFKYFVRTDDARRSRQTLGNSADITDKKGDFMVWLMLGINFTCFFLISICYISMNIIIRTSSKRSLSDQILDIKRQNMQIQNRITVIVATDFLCWVPFIIISALHNRKEIDATSWYVYFAMIALPLNSVINPLIYDNDLRRSIKDKLQFLITWIANFNIFSLIRERCRRRENITADAIEMEPMQNAPQIQQDQDEIEPAEDEEIGS
jgi:hypothetical protein